MGGTTVTTLPLILQREIEAKMAVALINGYASGLHGPSRWRVKPFSVWPKMPDGNGRRNRTATP